MEAGTKEVALDKVRELMKKQSDMEVSEDKREGEDWDWKLRIMMAR